MKSLASQRWVPGIVVVGLIGLAVAAVDHYQQAQRRAGHHPVPCCGANNGDQTQLNSSGLIGPGKSADSDMASDDSSEDQSAQRVGETEQELKFKKMGEEIDAIAQTGDLKALDAFVQKKYGFEVKELRKNEAGGYDLTVQGIGAGRIATQPLVAPELMREFERESLKIMNGGREIAVSEEDKKVMDEFRKAWSQK